LRDRSYLNNGFRTDVTFNLLPIPIEPAAPKECRISEHTNINRSTNSCTKLSNHRQNKTLVTITRTSTIQLQSLEKLVMLFIGPVLTLLGDSIRLASLSIRHDDTTNSQHQQQRRQQQQRKEEEE
jgi:hypothetical protein